MVFIINFLGAHAIVENFIKIAILLVFMLKKFEEINEDLLKINASTFFNLLANL